MARNPFRFGSGERNSFNPADWYAGSEAGAATLDALSLAKCKCGHTNVRDPRPTHLAATCAGCGTEID